MTRPLYKVLDPNLEPQHGGTGTWKIGTPRTVKGPLVPCRNGLHVCTLDQLVEWLGPCIHLVTAHSDEFVDGGDKLVFRSVTIGPALETWNDRTARWFAADCAERALRRERKAGREPDPRSWAAVRAARAFVNGTIGDKDRDAAWDAARAAAGAAAWDAAGAAAGAAAWAAAWAAAGAAAGAAERKWQAKRLGEYLTGKRGR